MIHYKMSRNLVDAHCHIHSCQKLSQEDIIAEAEKVGVKYMLNIFEIHKETINYMTHSSIFYGAAVHPQNVDEIVWQEAEKVLRQEMPNLHVIGETGLDLFRNKNLDKQIEYLENHVNLALEFNKPIVIHARDCHIRDITTRMKTPWQLHCFTFGMAEAKEVLNHGGYISFSGIVTFNRQEILREVVRYCPLESILIETDCPFLTPAPYRGQENYPKYVSLIYDLIAQIKGIEPAVLEQTVEANFRKFINI